MTSPEKFVFIMNMVGCGFAIFANLYAARHDDPRMRPVRAGVAVVAVLYQLGYWWVMETGSVDIWSKVMRGVSIWAWVVVWSIPPLWSVHIRRQDVKTIQEKKVSS